MSRVETRGSIAPAVLLALLAFLLGSPLSAQLRTPPGETDTLSLPPLSTTRVVDQLAVGVGSGAVGALLVGGGIYALTAAPHDGHDDGWGTLLALGVGALIGYPIGATTGVYLYSNRAERGSLLATVAGGAAGTLAGVILGTPTAGVSFVVGVPLGAAAGFNLTRRARQRILPPEPRTDQ